MPVAGQRLKALDFTSSATASDGTAQTNISTTPGYGSPQVAVTFVAPTSGRVQITVGMRCTDDSVTNRVVMDWELRLTSSSGSTVSTIGTWERWLELGCTGSGTFIQDASKTCIITSLTPGQLYWLALVQSAAVGGSADIHMRRIDVIPLPA